VDAQLGQASLMQARKMSHGARPKARVRAALPQQELAVALEEQSGAPLVWAAWQRPGPAR
jgi:hypothetical protein